MVFGGRGPLPSPLLQALPNLCSLSVHQKALVELGCGLEARRSPRVVAYVT